MANKRADQRSRIILEFGVWIQPYRELEKSTNPPSIESYDEASGKLAGSKGELSKRISEYLRPAPDVSFKRIALRISMLLTRFAMGPPGMEEAKRTGDLAQLHARFKTRLKEVEHEFMQWLYDVPVDWEPEIFEANTPFTAYLRIKSAMVAAKVRVDYFDRYLKKDFYDLFLNDLKRSLSIRLVTTAKEIKNLEPVSKVARQEFTDYQLIAVDAKQMHDRNLRVDQQIFALGPGVDRAGIAPTNFGPSESSPSAHGQLDKLISTGTIVHKS